MVTSFNRNVNINNLYNTAENCKFNWINLKLNVWEFGLRSALLPGRKK